MIIKIFYKKETHVMVIDKPDFEGLIKKIKASFVKLPDTINLSYVDSEGDRISVTDTNDLNVIFEIPNQKSIRLEVGDFESKECELEFKTDDFETFENVESIPEINTPVEEKKPEIKESKSLVLKFEEEINV